MGWLDELQAAAEAALMANGRYHYRLSNRMLYSDSDIEWAEKEYLAVERKYRNLTMPDIALNLIACARAMEQWKCPACGGSGKISSMVNVVHNDLTDYAANTIIAELRSLECNVCKGSGKHPRAYQALAQLEGKE